MRSLKLDLRIWKMYESKSPRTIKSGPGGIRTPDHGIKSPALYLAKLLARCKADIPTQI